MFLKRMWHCLSEELLDVVLVGMLIKYFHNVLYEMGAIVFISVGQCVWRRGPQAAEVFLTVLFSCVVSCQAISHIHTAFIIYNSI